MSLQSGDLCVIITPARITNSAPEDRGIVGLTVVVIERWFCHLTGWPGWRCSGTPKGVHGVYEDCLRKIPPESLTDLMTHEETLCA
jgi:hypothetical protein